jgi:hypothetical protein
MVLLRRLTLVASIVFCGSMALAAAGFAAGSTQPSFEATFNSLSASATVGASKGPQVQPGFFVFASRSSQTFEQGSAQASGKVSTTTQVFLSLNGPTPTAGCFEIPTSDFTISKSLQSATLNVTLDKNSTPCTGKGPAVPGGAKGPLANVPPPPPPGPLALPITLSVTWTGNGVVGTSRNSNSFECLDYSTQLSGTSRSSIANASGTNSAGDPAGFSTTSATINSDQSQQEVSGTPPQNCFPVFPG